MLDKAFLISYIIPVFAAFTLSDIAVMYLFIVVGVGHVAIAFIYTYRSKRSPLWYKMSIPVLGIMFYVLGWLVINNPQWILWYILASFALFCAHYYWDEIILVHSRFPTALYSGMISVISSFACFYVDAYEQLGNFHVGWELLLFGITVVTFFYFLLNIYYNHTLYSNHIILFTSISVLTPLLLIVLPVTISFLYVAGTVIIFHYIRWYIFYYQKTRSVIAPEAYATYRKFFIFVNSVVGVLFVVYWYYPDIVVLQGFFHPIYFYALANTHVAASFLKP
jgi:hypothetical protein